MINVQNVAEKYIDLFSGWCRMMPRTSVRGSSLKVGEKHCRKHILYSEFHKKA